MISVRRSSPKRSRISESSSLITASTRLSSPRIARSSAIRSSHVGVLLFDLRRPRARSAGRGAGRGSPSPGCRLSWKRSTSCSRAASRSREARISSMIASRCSSADQQALEDVRARLLLCELVLGAARRSPRAGGRRSCGSPRAGSACAGRRRRARPCSRRRCVCIGVCLKSLFSTTLGIASRLSSITMRMPRLSESSSRSEISGICLSWTSSAIFSISPPSPPFLTMIGQLGDDDRLLALLERLDVGARLDAHAAAAGLVGVADPGAAEDDRRRSGSQGP